jgi:hypothetical protein
MSNLEQETESEGKIIVWPYVKAFLVGFTFALGAWMSRRHAWPDSGTIASATGAGMIVAYHLGKDRPKASVK